MFFRQGKLFTNVAVILITVLFLAACGRKGPLFIPEEKPSQDQVKKNGNNKTESR